MRFRYKAQNEKGEIVEGKADAKDKLDLVAALRAEQKSVVFAEPISESDFHLIDIVLSLFNKVSLREKTILMRNLSAMIEAGLPLSRALNVLERQSKNKVFQELLRSLNADITRGESLSAAMKKHSHVFSSLEVSMAHAGEESGKLPEALSVVGEHLEQTYQLRRRVRGAMTYPTIVVIAMMIVGTLMMMFVVPTLTSTFIELKVELPFSTKIVILVSDFLRFYPFAALGSILGVIALAYVFLRSKRGKEIFGIALLYVPIIGGIAKEVNSARTTRTLASLLSSGVDMVETLSITEDVLQNPHYKKVLADARVRVQKGVQLSVVFSEYEDLYPVFVGEMIAVGEETGKLSDMLLRVASFYEEEVDQATKNLSTIIEPFLMVVIGIIVGFFAFSMITPMYTLMGSI